MTAGKGEQLLQLAGSAPQLKADLRSSDRALLEYWGERWEEGCLSRSRCFWVEIAMGLRWLSTAGSFLGSASPLLSRNGADPRQPCTQPLLFKCQIALTLFPLILSFQHLKFSIGRHRLVSQNDFRLSVLNGEK